MKKIINYNSSHNLSHNRKGSILIWSVLLGFIMTSVFFFFGMRQRMSIEVQRDTATILNEKSYLESYANFLVNNPFELNTTFDGIDIEMTRYADEISGSVDSGQSDTYQFSSDIFVEWNRCSDNLKGDLIVAGTTYTHDGAECDSDEEGYDDAIGPITVISPFTIETLNAPFYYSISGNSLKDNQWHISMSSELDYGKKVKINKTIEVTPPTLPVLDTDQLIADIKDEAAWIITAQRDTGSILMHPDSLKINPYFANFAALALLEINGMYDQNVKEYMEWYLNHKLDVADGSELGIAGAIYDYFIVSGNETPVNPGPAQGDPAKNYDASDSYAATFLTLARKYYDKTGDTEFIQNNMDDLKLIAEAASATWRDDENLTDAKPNYANAYIMDNAEVRQGYIDFAYLLATFGDSDSIEYSEKAEQIQEAIENSLWNSSNSAYDINLDNPGFDWSIFYPDATANIWTLVLDYPGGMIRANHLYQQFLINNPTWKDAEVKDDYFPQTHIGLACIAAGDYDTLLEFDANMTTNYIETATPRAWLYYIMESAGIIQYKLKLLEATGVAFE